MEINVRRDLEEIGISVMNCLKLAKNNDVEGFVKRQQISDCITYLHVIRCSPGISCPNLIVDKKLNQFRSFTTRSVIKKSEDSKQISIFFF